MTETKPKRPYYNKDNPHPLYRPPEIPNVKIGNECFYTGLKLARAKKQSGNNHASMKWNTRSKEHFINKASFLFPLLKPKEYAFNFGACAFGVNRLLRDVPLVVKLRFKEIYEKQRDGKPAPREEMAFTNSIRAAFDKTLVEFNLREKTIRVKAKGLEERREEGIIAFNFRKLSHFTAMDLNYINNTKFNGMDLSRLEHLLVSEFR